MQFTFQELVQKSRTTSPFSGRLLALDPGETTGYCLVDTTRDPYIWSINQITTWPISEATYNLMNLLDFYTASGHAKHVVLERYGIYAWMADDHKQSDVPTLQVIGTIKTLCSMRRIPHSEQTAQQVKTFCTDDKLKQWGLYRKGVRHGRDATRHACYWLLFHKTEDLRVRE